MVDTRKLAKAERLLSSIEGDGVGRVDRGVWKCPWDSAAGAAKERVETGGGLQNSMLVGCVIDAMLRCNAAL